MKDLLVSCQIMPLKELVRTVKAAELMSFLYFKHLSNFSIDRIVSNFVETVSKDSFSQTETIPQITQRYFLKVILLGYPEFESMNEAS